MYLYHYRAKAGTNDCSGLITSNFRIVDEATYNTTLGNIGRRFGVGFEKVTLLSLSLLHSEEVAVESSHE